MAETGARQIDKLSDVSQAFLSELKLWLEQVGLAIPVNQLTGFSQFTADHVEVITSESTASTTYTDLTTVGPQLTGLKPGKYVFFFGGLCTGGGVADTQWMAVSIAGATPSDNEATQAAVTADVETVARAVIGTLTDANGSTVKVQYRTSGGNSQAWSKRWLVALKYA